MTVIAFDPGISTGVAGRVEEAGYFTAVIVDVPSLWEIIDRHKPDYVVYENFAAGGLISKDGQATLRLVGAIQAVCYRMSIPTNYQMPQERYPFLQTARTMLKQIKRTPISHEVDALAHLLLYEDRVKKGTQDGYAAKRTRLI